MDCYSNIWTAGAVRHGHHCATSFLKKTKKTLILHSKSNFFSFLKKEFSDSQPSCHCGGNNDENRPETALWRPKMSSNAMLSFQGFKIP